MSPEKKAVAQEMFQLAWMLFVKYVDPPVDPEDRIIYLENIQSDVARAVLKYPCGLMEDLTNAVTAEHKRHLECEKLRNK